VTRVGGAIGYDGPARRAGHVHGRAGAAVSLPAPRIRPSSCRIRPSRCGRRRIRPCSIRIRHFVNPVASGFNMKARLQDEGSGAPCGHPLPACRSRRIVHESLIGGPFPKPLCSQRNRVPLLCRCLRNRKASRVFDYDKARHRRIVLGIPAAREGNAHEPDPPSDDRCSLRP